MRPGGRAANRGRATGGRTDADAESNRPPHRGACDRGPAPTDLAACRAGGDVPVVALAPVEMAPALSPTAAASQSRAVSQPTPVPVEVDEDPFNIFDDGEGSIVPAQNDAMERARALQGGNSDRDNDDPVIVPAPVIIDDPSSEGAVEVVMPDVDAMIDEITARATDPTRNPNVGNANRGIPAGQRDDRPGGAARKPARAERT